MMFAPLYRRIVIAAVVIAAMFVVALMVPLDGVAHGGRLRLLGRLHPLVVHFPLGLLLLVPVLEIFGRRRPALKEAAGFVLGLALLGAIVAVFAGVALARADGHEGELLLNHLWGGIAVAVGSALAWLIRGRSPVGYTIVLLATLGTLGWAAHQGGSLTHGSEYLTGPLPGWVKQVLRIPEAPVPETYVVGTVFADAVHPVLEKHCFACHGAEKQKGEYRMDYFASLLAGGKSGKHAIVPGQLVQSELVRRILLDTDNDKVMPPRKKPRPSAGEVALLRWWIKQGAPRDLAIAGVRDAPREVTALLEASAQASSLGEPVHVPRVGDYASLRGEIARLEQELGIKIVPVSRHAGDGLILRTRGAEARFGDAELAQLAKVAPFIVEAELAETRVTDEGFAALKPFAQLERLHLERTAVAGATLDQLQALSKLKYLNLCGTQITDETVSALNAVQSLKQLYLFGSHVTPAGVQALRASLPECEVGSVEVRKESTPDAAAGGPADRRRLGQVGGPSDPLPLN